MNKVALCVTNFNMPEATDAICEAVGKSVDMFVVDNGSDLVPPSKYTTIQLEKNVQTTGGWIAGWKEAKGKYLAYIFAITSATVIGNPVPHMLDFLESHPNVVGVHPVLTPDSTTSWQHMKYPGPTWMIDNIFAMWRADWFDSIGGFDPNLKYGWGIDLETCMQARMQNRGIYLLDGVYVRKITDIGYSMNRMGMTADKRRDLARENVSEVFTRKYGEEWRELLYGQ